MQRTCGTKIVAVRNSWISLLVVAACDVHGFRAAWATMCLSDSAVRMCVRVVRVQLGKNYLLHSIEMGQAKPPSKPMFFLKPLSSIIRQGQSIRVPPGAAEIHHEVELGVVINGDCSGVTEESAMDHVAGYVLALDMTAREEQVRAVGCVGVAQQSRSCCSTPRARRRLRRRGASHGASQRVTTHFAPSGRRAVSEQWLVPPPYAPACLRALCVS